MNTLICGVNWLGDCIMSMPAIEVLKRKRPDDKITILAKSGLKQIWDMHGAVDSVIEFRDSPVGTMRAARDVARYEFDVAYVFPNSFRSALIPFLARVPRRVGAPGDHRSRMLTHLVGTEPVAGYSHQLWEYARILGLCDNGDEREELRPLLEAGVQQLHMPKSVQGWLQDVVESHTGPLAGLVPGAARGPSKQWPAESYVELGRTLIDCHDCRIAVVGTEKEAKLCLGIAQELGPMAVDLSGKTSLPQLAWLFGQCAVVVANDSGGMHLAAASGATVVALYGLTDPDVTGPIGRQHTIIGPQDGNRSRDIARDSTDARHAMLSIQPEQVLHVVAEILANR